MPSLLGVFVLTFKFRLLEALELSSWESTYQKKVRIIANYGKTYETFSREVAD
jgi:hypothetical protein